MKKRINVNIESNNDISLKDAEKISQGIEKSLPKNIKVKWWGWSFFKRE